MNAHMSVKMEELLASIVKQQQQLNQQLMKLLLQSKNAVTYSANGMSNSSEEFLYNPEEGITFSSYYGTV